MDLETAFYSLLHQELADRYDRLSDRYGAEHVVEPTASLVESFADVTAIARSAGGADAVRDCVRYAGETYEYIMDRWQDPRWRTIVSIAVQLDHEERERGTPRTTAQRHRSAGYYSRTLATT